MASASLHPRVGVAALVCNEKGEVIMGKRAGSHGAGTWAFPGGHLEMGESFFECAERETLEETGLKVKATKVVAVTNDVMSDTKHYITIFVRCERDDAKAQPEVLEPEKCEGWHWISWSDVRQWCEKHEDMTGEWAERKCFLPIRNLVKDHPQLDVLR
ncbi:nudix domain-containing protein [Xylariomycetidae sp. FL0641]|nr:nudix domain-containing protein [Xylariomycetidae sp. FL0641]